MGRGLIRLALPLGMSVVLAAEDDAALLAATRCLDQGRPQAALAILGDPVLGRRDHAAVLRIAALAALGDADGTRRVCGDLREWPPQWRGLAALHLGRSEATAGDLAAARTALLVAVADLRPPWPAVDLLMEVAGALGDRDLERRCAEGRWNQRPRGVESAAAGLRLAAMEARADPDAARRLLAEVRALPGLPADQDLAASETLCALLVDERPAECLLLAERGLAAGLLGDLPLWRAVGLAALDPVAGREAIRALPRAQQEDPRVRRALRGMAPQAQARPIELASVDAALGRWPAVRVRLDQFADQDPQALALVLAEPGRDPSPFVGVASARTPVGAVALARAWLARGDAVRAWGTLAPLAGSDADGIVLAWAWRAASAAGDPRAAGLGERLRGRSDPVDLVAEAWADHANRLPGDDAIAAWDRAMQGLPPSHPWRLRGIDVLLRACWRDAYPVERALAWAETLPQSGDDQWRAVRFLEAQVAARTGLGERVKMVVALLVPGATPAQVERLRRLEGGSPGVSPGLGDTPPGTGAPR